MPLFRRKHNFGERDIPEPDWSFVRERMAAGEREIDACKGWSVALYEGDLDHPCAVYLTDRAIYLDITPDTLAAPETLVIPFEAIGRCQVGPSDRGTPRLVVVYDPVGNEDPDDLRGVGVDLRPEERGWAFGEQVREVCEDE